MKQNTDIKIKKQWGIPLRTLQDWKNTSEDNWRNKIYRHLKEFKIEEKDKK